MAIKMIDDPGKATKKRELLRREHGGTGGTDVDEQDR